MPNTAINWARDLTPPIKAAIESLLGRPLQDDEQVRVRVFRCHAAPQGEARRKAAHHLEEHLKRMADRVKEVSQDEMEAAIDEALLHVRPRRP
jgi:hypothetical protein